MQVSTRKLLSFADMDFIRLQLDLPGNNPLNAPLGTILDPFGIRNTQGIGNNVTNPLFGAADQMFVRLTTPQYKQADGTFFFGPAGLTFVPVPTSYAVRDVNLYDSDPRVISNLVSNQSDASLLALGYTPNELKVAVQDDPAASPGGRLSPLTGNMNPLPYSGFMTLFGQFFDHGLDFVKKGADGLILVPLLPDDPLYNHPDNAVYASDGTTIIGYNNFIIASRTNTVHVDISISSTDSLVQALGLREDRYTTGEPGVANGTVTGDTQIGAGIAEGGVLILNKVVIEIARGSTAADVIAAINAHAAQTGVSAAIDGSNHLVLTYAAGESVNTVSPFIDLSQSYGSVASHTAFIREYDTSTLGYIITGRLVSGTVDHDGDSRGDGMATWKDVKFNASVVGVILHDKDVLDIPEVRMAAEGVPFLGTNASGEAGMWLVSRDKVTGQVYYVKDSMIGANNFALALNADGTTTNVSGDAFLAIKGNLVLQTIGHAFLDDMAHNVLGSLDPLTGDLTSLAGKALLDSHFIAGDGRANENIGLTAIHDVFHAEHNRVVTEEIMSFFQKDANGNFLYDANGSYIDLSGRSWSGEDIFQAAKLVTEMEYQHLVFGEFARKLSPNINAFAAYNITIDPAISAEFAHAVYRFGHSMLTETVDLTGFDPLTGLSTGVDKSMGLIEAFLNPGAFTATTAGELAIGMSNQVGNAIDEWVTGALRNNLVGLPLDLATLNIVRGRDTGMPSLNETRAQLFAQTGLSSLKPYVSWDDFGQHLLHPESIENFIMAYARDAILNQFGDSNTSLGGIQRLTLEQWTALQSSGDSFERAQYADALRAAARAAINDAAFMNSNIGLNDIDLWLGGLAEVKVPGGMLGATFDFIFAMQMINLQNADRFYYLHRLAGTDLLVQIEGQLFSDIVMRNTGVQHLYSDIFSVADASIEIGTPGTAGTTYGTLSSLTRATHTEVDAYGNVQTVGTSGWVGSNELGWTFYGNPGEYLDARGVFSPNNTASLKGNVSETIGGTSNAERINALGGNDTVWGDEGNDTIEGGEGNDFLHGGDGNDVITDSQGDDFLWGDRGDDVLNAGSGLDQVFGGEGNDVIRGGLGADVLNGELGNDVIYGDDGAITMQLVNGVMIEVMDRAGDADIIDGGQGNDTIFGGGGDDVIDAGAGNDVIYGGLGNDAMIGLGGNDVFVMDASDIGFGNSMDGGVDHDTVDYSASMGSGLPGPNGNRPGINIDLNPIAPILAPIGAPPLADLFLSIEEVIGSNFDDTIRGGGSVPLNLGLITDEFGAPVNFGTVAFPLFRTYTVTIDGGAGNDVIEGGDGRGQWLVQPDGTYGFEGWALNPDGVTYTYVSPSGAAWDPTTPGPGMDILTGGIGIDTISYATAASTAATPVGAVTGPTPGLTGITVNLSIVDAQNTVNAGWDLLSGFENVLGSAFNDTITGDGNANILNGADGDDTIDGGAGDDTLIGGLGADILTGGAGADTVSYRTTNSTSTAALGAGFAVPGVNGVNIDLSIAVAQDTLNAGLDTLTGIENVIGSIFDDTISGGADTVLVANVLDGGDGADSILGGGGNDTLIGGLGADTLNGGAGTDTISYAGTTASVAVNLSAATIGTSTLGPVASNRTAGGAGIDTLLNVENVIGGDGNDTIVGSAVANQLEGGLGDDSLLGDGGNDTLIGGAGNDTLDGGAGNDSLVGGAGNDVFSDGSGVNTMVGGLGNDVYTVAAGETVVELADEGEDTVRTALATYALAANVENLTFTGSVAFTADGNTLANVISGGIANDTLRGGDGNDTLIGGLGNDSLVGGVGIDTASYATSTGAVTVNLTSNTATGAAGSDTLVTIENVIGGSGNDTLVGNAGANVLDGGLGDDSMAGGDGDDVYIVDSANDAITENLNAGTDLIRTTLSTFSLATKGANVENLTYIGSATFTGTGNDLNNVITGGAGNDTLSGGIGNDTLIGGEGNDRLLGGAGNDVYFIDSLSDVVVEVTGEGLDTVRTSLSAYTLGNNVENLTYIGSISFYGVGNSLSNVITGAAGNDTLIGGLGDDVLDGGLGSDTVSYAGAFGAVVVNLANGTASGTQGNDVLISIENLIGGEGNDSIVGSDADNTLDGRGGVDTLIGGLGNDTYIVDSNADLIIELPNEGVDTVVTSVYGYTLGGSYIENLTFYGASSYLGYGNQLANIIIGGVNDDTLYGEYGDDTLDGGDGNDTLYGGVGNDTLRDGKGINILAGGDGNDFYIVASLVGDRILELVGDGIDTVLTAAANYTLGANVENLTYTGTSALIGFGGIGNELDNVITGGIAGDNLSGAAGNDTLIGGLGNDNLDGGAGVDTASYATATSAVTVSLATRLSSRGAGADTLTSIENLIGSGFNDVLTGDAGANTIEGAAGNDTMSGGAGNDTVSYANATGGITLSLANQTILFGGPIAQNTGGAGTDRIDGFENIIGSAFADDLTGDGNANRIDGGLGADTLSGGGGNDTLIGGAGADSLEGGAGADSLVGGVGTDTLLGGTGDDILDGGTGTDTASYAGAASAVTVNLLTNLASGGAGNDTLISIENVVGSSNNDTIVSGAGNNRLDGGAGNDTVSFAGSSAAVIASLAAGTATGGSGTDTLVAIENLVGTAYADRLTGDANANFLDGGEGNNTLSGGLGDDTLMGGTGDDQFDGGDGNDTVTYSNATAAIVVDMVTPANNQGVGADQFVSIENIVGSGFNDAITGDGSANNLDGAAGNDTLIGGAGNDTLIGGLGDDRIDGGLGTDTASYADAATAVSVSLTTNLATGGAGNDTLVSIENIVGSAFNDTIVGSASANLLEGGAGADSIDGGDGNDTVIGGAGNDTMAGGVGNDTVSYASATAAVAVNLTTNAATGGAGTDVLSGFENIIGSAFNDTLTGAVADANTMTGGLGNDTYVVDTATDAVVERAGEGTDLVQTALASLTLFDNVENLTYTGVSTFTGTGNALANVLTGGTGNDTLNGGDGNDTLIGGLGNDSLIGGAGIDTVSYAGIATAVTVNLATGVATGGGGSDTLVTIENITGGSAADSLTGNSGANYIDGGAGSDTMIGGAGDDTYVVDVATDVVTELAAEGTDTVRTGLATYTLGTNVENLIATRTGQLVGTTFTGTGNTLNNVITGTSGADSLSGGAGDDTLIGGGTNALNDILGAADTLDGGTGNDTVTFEGLTAAVSVTLATQGTTNTANQNVTNGVIRLNGIENLLGTAFGDTLTGDGNANVLNGADGNDTISGGLGNDTLIGGAGNDTASYASAASAVTVDLTAGTATGGAGTDTLSLFENLIGSGSADRLTGDSNANILDGGAGADTLVGAGGSDTLIGGAGNDLAIFAGSKANYTFIQDPVSGNIVVRGASGNTVLIGVENIQFSATPGTTELVSSLPLSDITAPTVVAFSSTTANGSYSVGSSIQIRATMSETVVLGSKLTVTLNTGEVIDLTAGSAGTVLTGTYVVKAGQFAGSLAVESFTFDATGVLDSVGNALVSSVLPVSNINTTSALVVDTISPEVVNFTSSATDGSYSVGSRLVITANLSEVVLAGSKITVLLSSGATLDLTTPVDSNSLRGTYVVQAGDNSNGILIVESFTIASGSTDLAGNIITPGTGQVIEPAQNTNIDSFRTLSIDTLGPDAPVILSLNDDVAPATRVYDQAALDQQIITNDRKPTLSIVAEAGTRVDIYNGDRFLGSATQVSLVENTTNAVFSFTPAFSLGEGTYVLTAKAVDAAGNTSVASNDVGLLVDITAPMRPTVDTLMTVLSSPTVTGTLHLTDGEVFSVQFGSTTYSATNVAGTVTYGQEGGLLSVDLVEGTWSLGVSGLTDGKYSVDAWATDLAGNVIHDATSQELTVNTANPTVVSFSSTTVSGSYRTGATINITATMSELVKAGSTITVTLSNNVDVMLTTPTTTSASTILRGVYTVGTNSFENTSDLTVQSFSWISATAPKNLAGTSIISATLPDANIGVARDIVIALSTPDAPSITSIVDDVAPFPGEITTISAKGYTNDNTPTISITGTAGQTVRILNGDIALGIAIETAPGVYTYTPTNSLVDGTYTFYATVTDSAGNTSAKSAGYLVKIDTTAPAVPTVTKVLTTDTSPEISGTVTLGTDEYLTVTVGGTTYSTSTTPALVISGTTWTLQLPEMLPNTTFDVVVKVTDEAGNATTDVTTGELTIDTLAPTVAGFSAVTADGSYKSGASITLVATMSEVVRAGSAIVVTLDTGETVELKTASAGTTLTGTYVVGSGVLINSADLNVTGIALGGTSFGTIVPTDASGNVATSTALPTGNNLANNAAIVIDTIAPLAGNITGYLDNAAPTPTILGSVTNDTTPTLLMTAETGSTVSVYDGATLLGTATETVVPGEFTFTPSAQAEGLHSYSFIVTDRAGNVGPASTSFALTIDTILPTVPTVNALTTNNQLPVITGTATLLAGETLTVSVNGSTFTYNVDSALTMTGSTWSLQVPGSLAGGTYTVVAAVTDLAGNVVSDATSNELIIDRTAPVVSRFTSTSANGTYGPGSSINITATMSEVVKAGSQIVVTLGTGGAGDLVTLTAAADGTTLTGTYLVGSADTSPDLNVTSYAIGGTAPVDLAGNVMTTTAAVTGVNTLASSSAIVVTGTPVSLSNGGNTYTVTAFQPTVLGNGGNDTLNASALAVNVSLDGGIGNDTLLGGSGNDTLIGFDGSDSITGGAGNDTINGGLGNDTLFGGLGMDVLTGGAGADIYVFNTALGVGNVDQIIDFSVVDDTIQLENTGIFSALTATGTLNAGFFVANTTGTAVDGNDYILYNTTTGALLYDADGSGAGAAVQFATITPGLSLTNADFSVI